jgi:hypothetical protein
VDIVIRDLRSAVEGVVAKLALGIQGQLILTTPVDTGWARSNWGSAISAPLEGTPGDNPTIAGLKWSLVDGPIYVTNNVNYISILNAGHSQQAPAGFVEIAITKEINRLQNKRLS